MSKIIYADRKGPAERPGPIARLLRALILCGVWILVGLAGLAAWARLAA